MNAENRFGTKFVPAFFVNPVEIGEEFNSGEMPRHVTLFPPVLTNFTSDRIGQSLKTACSRIEPFSILVGDDAWFGVNHDILVQRIQESKQLKLVHETLARVVGHLMHDPTFRQPYNPHVTVKRDRLPFREELVVDCFSVVAKNDGGKWLISDKVQFKGFSHD